MGVLSPSCREGHRIPIGGLCTAACPEGFAATTPVLVCNYASQLSQLPWFSPHSFTCLPLSCVAPPCAGNVSKPTCQGGWNVPHGKLCLPNCLPGYAPSVPYLRCSAGTLQPSTYSCSLQGISCAAPVVQGASSPSCVEGDIIAHQGVCTPNCDEGTATVTTPLECEAGQLTPLSFECARPCFLSQVPSNALLPPCAEGFSIPHGGRCTYQCDVGFRAEPAFATCNRGSLGAAVTAFECVQMAQDCIAPSSAFLLGIGYVVAPGQLCAGSSTESVGHLQECQSQCPRSGFSPTPRFLSCSDGVLTPDRFTCGKSCLVTWHQTWQGRRLLFGSTHVLALCFGFVAAFGPTETDSGTLVLFFRGTFAASFGFFFVAVPFFLAASCRLRLQGDFCLKAVPRTARKFATPKSKVGLELLCPKAFMKKCLCQALSSATMARIRSVWKNRLLAGCSIAHAIPSMEQIAHIMATLEFTWLPSLTVSTEVSP
eukprot:symbB.v1.2.013936.t1/scaffold998.1/size145810/2